MQVLVHITRWLTAISLLGLVGCSYKLTTPPSIAYPDYRVGAPDQIEVTVLPEPRIQQQVTVRPDGKITVELVGDVQAGGRTTQDIADEIERRVARFKRGAVVTVSLVATQSPAVTVLGEVRGPTTFALVRQMRVAEAIGMVGDITPFANDDSVRVIRSGEKTKVIMVDLDAIRAGDMATNIQLYAGDVVYVPPSLLARIGYAIQLVLFPFQPLFGVANSVGGNLITP